MSKIEPNVKVKTEKGDLWSNLTLVTSIRNSQDQVLWTFSGIFGAANLLLIAVYFSSETIIKNGNPGRILIPVVGIVLSLFWNVLNSRAIKIMKMMEEIKFKIESIVIKNPEHATSPLINTTLANKHKLNCGIKGRTLIGIIGKIFILIWSISLLLIYLK